MRYLSIMKIWACKATTLTVTAVLAERKATDKGGSSVVRRPYVGISPAYGRQRRAPTAVAGSSRRWWAFRFLL